MRIGKIFLWMVFLFEEAHSNCFPEVNNSGPLRFTQNTTVEDFARKGHYRDVLCCAAGYDTILWYHEINKKWLLFPWYPMSGSCEACEEMPALADNNKTLQIKSFGSLDGGQYRCEASNKTSGKTITHTTLLIGYSCSPRTGPPLPLPPTNSRYVDLGQTVTYTCQGDYGCGDPEDGDVMWYIVKDGDWIDIDSNYRRYNVTQFDREARTIKGANLTIKNIQEEDYSVVFLCDIGTVVGGYFPNLQISLQLQKRVQNKYIFLLFGLVPIIIFILSILLCYMCWSRFSFFVKSRNCIGRIPDKGNKKYHVFLYHTDDQENVVDDITNEFKKRHYNVSSIMDNVAPGEDVHAKCRTLANESFSIVFLVPKKDKIGEQEKNLMTNFLNSSLQEFNPGFVSLILEMDEKDSMKNHYLKEEISGLFCIKYIDENAFGLKRKKFFSRLQHRLPKPDASVRYHNGDHPDRRPLLQTPTPTPVNAVNKTFEFPQAEAVEVINDITLVNNGVIPENLMEEAKLRSVMERQISRPFQPSTENEMPEPDTQVKRVTPGRNIQVYQEGEVSKTEEGSDPYDNGFHSPLAAVCEVDIHDHPNNEENVISDTRFIPIANSDRSKQPLKSSSFESGYQSYSRNQSVGSPMSSTYGSGSEDVTNRV